MATDKDVVIDEEEETTKADLLVADPDEEEAEKTIAENLTKLTKSYQITIDFPAENTCDKTIFVK